MDENRTRLEQPQQDAPKKRSLWPLFFFPMALLYHELLLHAFDRTILFWDTPLVYILLFSAAGGFLLSALVDILPRKAAHIVTYALCVFWTVLTCIEYCCKSYFKSYWGLSFITQMTGNVVGNFFSTMLEIIFGRIVFILLSFLPLVLLIIAAACCRARPSASAAALWRWRCSRCVRLSVPPCAIPARIGRTTPTTTSPTTPCPASVWQPPFGWRPSTPSSVCRTRR